MLTALLNCSVGSTSLFRYVIPRQMNQLSIQNGIVSVGRFNYINEYEIIYSHQFLLSRFISEKKSLVSWAQFLTLHHCLLDIQLFFVRFIFLPVFTLAHAQAIEAKWKITRFPWSRSDTENVVYFISEALNNKLFNDILIWF